MEVARRKFSVSRRFAKPPPRCVQAGRDVRCRKRRAYTNEPTATTESMARPVKPLEQGVNFLKVVVYKEYYYLDGCEQNGPLDVDQLRTVGLKPDTFVWADGLDDWKPAKDVEELKFIFNKPLPPPPPIIEKTTSLSQKTNNTSMLGKIVISVIVCVFGLSITGGVLIQYGKEKVVDDIKSRVVGFFSPESQQKRQQTSQEWRKLKEEKQPATDYNGYRYTKSTVETLSPITVPEGINYGSIIIGKTDGGRCYIRWEDRVGDVLQEFIGNFSRISDGLNVYEGTIRDGFGGSFSAGTVMSTRNLTDLSRGTMSTNGENIGLQWTNHGKLFRYIWRISYK